MNIRRLGSVLGLVVTLTFASITAAAQGRPSLITPPRGGDLLSGQDIGGAVTRARTVTPDARVITRALDALQLRPTRPVEIEIPFFDDVTLVVHLTKVERAGKGVTNFYGTVEGDPLGSVVITNSRGTLVMNVLYQGKSYQVLSSGGRYIAKEVDRSKLQDAEGDDTMIPPRLKSSADRPPMVADGAGTIDVMVIYTSAARAAVGSVAAIEAEIDAAIASTNQAYSASGITQRLNLVHTQEIAYTSDTAAMNQTVMSTALNAITNGTAPFTAVPGLRNTHGADLVSLWVQGAGNSTTICGLGWLLQTNSSAGDEYGYSVVLREPCAISNGSFAHELGHNMGLQHDTYVSPTGTHPTFVPYAHGYVRITAPRFRTIMAYNDHCQATGGSCTR